MAENQSQAGNHENPPAPIAETSLGSQSRKLASPDLEQVAARPDRMLSVHPELRETTAAVADMFDTLPKLSDETLADFRAAMEQWARPVSELVPVERRAIAGPDGEELVVYIVNARPGTCRPAILHTHGGGFVAGAAQIELGTQQELAGKLDCVCVSVEYRLAPEVRWQGSLNDNYTALSWLHDHAPELGVNPNCIAVMGESAGGAHAALLAIEARNRGEIPLVMQLLVYPMLDDRTGSSRAVAAHLGTMIWTRESNRYGWKSFLGLPPGGEKVPAGAVPARVEDLAGLPPTFIGVGALDLFLEENVVYAQRLVAAGVETELHVVPGAVHGFDEFSPDASLVKHFVSLKLSALRRAFGLPID